jgi:hypothetical protein
MWNCHAYSPSNAMFGARAPTTPSRRFFFLDPFLLASHQLVPGLLAALRGCTSGKGGGGHCDANHPKSYIHAASFVGPGREFLLMTPRPSFHRAEKRGVARRGMNTLVQKGSACVVCVCVFLQL